MLKLTKTGIGLLTKQYRSVLKKCLLLNLGLLLFNPVNTFAYIAYDYQYLVNEGNGIVSLRNGTYINGIFYSGLYITSPIRYLPLTYYGLRSVADDEGWNYLTGISEGVSYYDVSAFNFASVIALDSKLYSVENQLLNYYYTFRDDKTSEIIEFAEELKTSFPVILRSAEHDVRISAQSAARIDTGLKSGDRHVALLLTMTNQGVNVSEAPLTFSAKTRDDSLFLGFMEVCHA